MWSCIKKLLLLFFTGEEGPSRLHNLFVQNQELMQSFHHTENHITQVRAQLKDREVGLVIQTQPPV